MKAIALFLAMSGAFAGVSYGLWWLFYGRPDIAFWIWFLIIAAFMLLQVVLDREASRRAKD